MSAHEQPTSSAKPRLLIAGMGYVGAFAAELAATRGATVFGLVRSARALPLGVTQVLGDVTRSGSLAELPSPIDAVIYAVAPDAHDEHAYEEAYPTGLETLLGKVTEASGSAPRVILVSSTAVYRQSADELVDESSVADAPEPKARSLRRAEQLAAESHPRSLVVRASGIYGPERTSLARRLATSAPPTELRDTLTCRIHRVDLGRILVDAVFDSSLHGLVLASDPHPASLRELHDWLLTREVPPPASLAPSRGERNRKSRRLTPTRLLERGFVFRYPSFREGYGELFAARSD